MLFNAGVDDTIPAISRLVSFSLTQRAVYAIEHLATAHKNYLNFFKANYENFNFFDVDQMKAENA